MNKPLLRRKGPAWKSAGEPPALDPDETARGIPAFLEPEAANLLEALEILLDDARAAELSYRAAERRVRDRGLAAQLAACVVHTQELQRLAVASFRRLGAVPRPTPSHRRFSPTASDGRILESLLTIEERLFAACDMVRRHAHDELDLVRDLRSAQCAIVNCEAWLVAQAD